MIPAVTDTLYPLFFEPVFRHYIWGGRALETLFSRQLPPGDVAESWEISGHPSSPTRVATGAYRGRLLPELLGMLGPQLVGRRAVHLGSDRFPLLVKLLDANHDLSLQVHPDDAIARREGSGDLGKTEMWYILHARPGAEIVFGLARGATQESFAAALRDGRLESQLHRLPVRAGDCVFIPAGMLHALLAGVVVVEIQQNSDTTYRVYDWGRVGPDGKQRPLHIAQALRAIDFGLVEPTKVMPEPLSASPGVARWQLVRCPQFVVERIELEAGATYSGCCDGTTFEIWGCLAGHCALHWPAGAVHLASVGFALLPAALGGFALQAPVPCTLLRAYLGHRSD